MIPLNASQRSNRASQTVTSSGTSTFADVFSYAIHRGVSEQQLRAETGLVRTDLINPEIRLPGELFHSIWKLIAAACPGQAVGIQNGSAAPLSALGLLPQSMKYAETLRSALQALVSYGPLLSAQICLELVESEGEALLQTYHPLDALDGGIVTEYFMSMTWRSIQQAIGKEDSLVRVEFVHQPHSLLRFYEAFFDVPVRFKQPRNALVFRRAALDIPAKQSDIYLFKYVQGNLDLLRDRWGLSSHRSPLAEIHDTIARNAEGCEYRVEEIARSMNMSRRSLQRMVNDHGFTLRQLLENARRAKAQQLLRDPTISIAAIATQLGYSDARAFRRAFKRWTGETPPQFRGGLIG